MTTSTGQSVKLEIYGQTYTVRTDADTDYLLAIAQYVDERMNKIAQGSLTVDSLRVAVLAAIHIADELHQLKKRYESLDEQLAVRSSEVASVLDQYLRKDRKERQGGPVEQS